MTDESTSDSSSAPDATPAPSTARVRPDRARPDRARPGRARPDRARPAVIGATGLSTGPYRPIGGRTWVDVAVLLALGILGVIGFEQPFGGSGFLLPGLGGLAVGAATGLLAGMFRLSVPLTVLGAVLAYFLLGTPFAVPGQGIGGVLPTFASLGSLAVGAVFGWKDIVTLQTPIGAPEYISVVPFVATWVVALVATSLASRWLPNRPRAPWRQGVMLIGPVLLYLAGILTGTDTPYQAGLRGVTFAVLALVWLGWRSPSANVAKTGGSGRADIGPDAAFDDIARSGGTRLRNRKIAGTAILVAGAVLVGGGSAIVLAPPNDQRFVLREEIEPPFDPLQFASPLSGFREYSKLQRDELLFTVSGLQPGDLVRLATMDTFTGKLWNVTGPATQTDGSGSFALVGNRLPPQSFITPVERQVEVTIEAYDDVWLPSVGYPTRLDFETGPAVEQTDDLRYNASTGTAVLTTGLERGDSYRISADVQRVLDTEDVADAAPAAITLPPITDNPDITTSKAQEYAGGAVDPAEKLEAIRLNLAEKGFLSHGLASDTVPSRAGHGADRIDDLLSRNQMIGDEEQYASAFALMASTYGFPARVVMGFAPDVVEGEAVEVHGEDVTAWVEVAFDGIGWVSYNPTPDETDIPQDQTPKPQIEPQPQVRQPPRALDDPEDLLTPVELDNEDPDDELPFALPGWVIVVGISILVLAGIVFLPLLVIAALKALRARRRRTRGSPDRRVAEAWAEMVDRYSELGFDVPQKSTRPMVADDLAGQVVATMTAIRPVAPDGAGEGAVRAATADEADPNPRATLRHLAAETDQAVFAGRAVDDESSERIWTEALAAVAIAGQAVTSSRRILSRYRMRRASRRSRSGGRRDRRS